MSDSYVEVQEGVGKKLRTIEKTIGVDIVHEEVVQVENTVSVYDTGGITYSSVPIGSITFDYVGGTLSTINFYNLDSSIEFSLVLGYTGETLTSIVRS